MVEMATPATDFGTWGLTKSAAIKSNQDRTLAFIPNADS
jgi:hypothetical protein